VFERGKGTHVTLIECESSEWIYQTFTDNNNTTTTTATTTTIIITTTTTREHNSVRLEAKNSNGADLIESECNPIK
jgi:hypothetical protein